MRPVLPIAGMLSLASAFAQSQDLPPEISFAGDSVAPSQLWPGNIAQLYEANAPSGPVTATENTAAQALTNAGVWGHDEGPSVLLADGRVLWYWGDSVTGYQQTGISACTPGSSTYCAYQLQQCTSNGIMESCLGADTVSFVPAAGVPAKLYGCLFISSWDNALLAGQTFTPDYSHCSQMQYIAPHPGGNGAPKAGFTFESAYLDPAYPLAPGEDLLLGHTATGLFAVPDKSDGTKEPLYVLYQVQSTNNAGFNFRTESILMRSSGYTSAITSGSMPVLGRYYAISSVAIPSGTVAVVNGSTTATLTHCSGSPFTSAWSTSTLWQGMLIQDPSGNSAVYPIQSASGTSVTITGTVPNNPSNTCGPTAVQFDTVPTQQGNTGKFMYNASELLSASVISGLGPSVMPWLPANTPAVCIWGASFYYRQSNTYLACAPGDDGTLSNSSNQYYPGYGASVLYCFTGFSPAGLPQWQTVAGGTVAAEPAAVPLLYSWNHAGSSNGAPCIGENSVRWIPPLHRFLMTYGSAACGGLYYRTATAPWGPWSAETRFFPNNPSYGWEQRIIYGPGAVGTPDFNTSSWVPLYDPVTGNPVNNSMSSLPPFDQRGNPYGPYLYPGATDLLNTDGSGTVTVLMNMSGFNPYVTWQLAARFYVPTGVSLSGTVKITPSVKIVP